MEIEGGYMVPYTVTLAPSKVTFEMIPVPAGEYLIGSPEDEAGHRPDEGPQVKIAVAPFWIAKHEVRWAEYKQFMSLYTIFKKFESAQVRTVTEGNKVDAITAPTELYEPSFTYEYGEDPQQPAVTMTQYAAKQYSKWLSGITGQQFRLPTEAEWEYACRAGTKTPWSFGDDPEKIGEYAWFKGNSDDNGAHKVGLLKPNAWGIHDMHGNVAEWVLDMYKEDGYTRLKGKEGLTGITALAWPDEEWPRIVRGGSWENDPIECRSASKLGSDDLKWKDNDPNRPRSPWWFTDDPARGVGFRLVRPLQVLPRDEIAKFWEIDDKFLEGDVELRLEEGRGVLGIVDPTLPKAIQELQESEK
ncbi:MAG: formylglycine-generating enzyme family protein [Planctomycetaceae bacterium]